MIAFFIILTFYYIMYAHTSPYTSFSLPFVPLHLLHHLSHSPVNELHWSMSQSTFLGSYFGCCSSIFFHCIDMYWLYNIPDSCSCLILRSSDNSKWSPMWYNCEFTFQVFLG